MQTLSVYGGEIGSFCFPAQSNSEVCFATGYGTLHCSSTLRLSPFPVVNRALSSLHSQIHFFVSAVKQLLGPHIGTWSTTRQSELKIRVFLIATQWSSIFSGGLIRPWAMRKIPQCWMTVGFAEMTCVEFGGQAFFALAFKRSGSM